MASTASDGLVLRKNQWVKIIAGHANLNRVGQVKGFKNTSVRISVVDDIDPNGTILTIMCGRVVHCNQPPPYVPPPAAAAAIAPPPAAPKQLQLEAPPVKPAPKQPTVTIEEIDDAVEPTSPAAAAAPPSTNAWTTAPLAPKLAAPKTVASTAALTTLPPLKPPAPGAKLLTLINPGPMTKLTVMPLTMPSALLGHFAFERLHGPAEPLTMPPVRLSCALVRVLGNPVGSGHDATGLVRGVTGVPPRRLLVELNDGTTRLFSPRMLAIVGIDDAIFDRIEPSRACVYVLVDRDRPHVESKIGMSASPQGALDAMARGNPHATLFWSRVVGDAVRTEALAHTICPHRIYANHEWFRVEPELAEMCVERAITLVEAALELKSFY